MGKHRKYIKHYRTEWEKMPIFKHWLSRASEELVNNGKGEAYCKICNTPLRAHKTDLEKHAKSKTHKEREQNFTAHPKLTSFGYSKGASYAEKSNDIQMAVYVASHSSIRSVDHLGEIVKDMGKGSSLENIHLHRTKCSNIIKNLLEPALRQQLIREIGNRPYSIILDESTDVATEKYMAYMVRYYNEKNKSITVDFLGFQCVIRATAAELYSAFKEFIREVGLNLNNLIAIGTDGANNLCGKKNSLYTHLKAELPHLQLLKCVCHSLSLCSAKACQELPSSLEYMLRETRNWFSHSPLRIKMYHQVYETLNNNKKPPKLVQLAATRWLSFHAAVEANIKQWIPLKTHFNIICSPESGEKCYQARELASMYNDETHLLYLVFLAPLLKEVTDLNIVFQAESADITKIYNDLRLLLISTARRVFKPASLNVFCDSNKFVQDIEAVKAALSKSSSEFENSLLELESIDFGYKFEEIARKSNVPINKVREVRKRCSLVLVRLCQEFVNRFPDNMLIVQLLQCFNPENTCCVQSTRPKIVDMPWLLAPANANRENIESQWRIISTMRIEDIPGVDQSNLTPEKFWVCVLQIKNAGGQHVFEDLAEFALRALSLPISNATVERVFSVMNTVKTKLRNKMQLPMLQAITRTRVFLGVRKMCCNNFKPTQDMIKMHNFHNIYKPKNDQSDSSTDGPSTSSVSNDRDDDGGILDEILLLVADEE